MPQPRDWLWVWRQTQQGTSFRACQGHFQTQAFLDDTPASEVHRKTIKQMQDIFAEAIRATKRLWLRQAEVISLITDDRGGYKLLCFRCNHGTAFKQGVFGIVRRTGQERSLESFQEDYSATDAETIWQLVQRFCTPLGAGLDEELLKHIQNKL